MTRPDLSNPEERRAYNEELRGIAFGWRMAGLAIVTLGAIGFVAAARMDAPLLHSRIGLASVAAELIGWTILIGVIVKRTRHHRQRMAG